MPYFKTENGNAENIKYDNTKSVKEAIDDIKDNVQDAITEVNGKLDNISTKIANVTINAVAQEKTQISNIRNEKGHITTDPMETERRIK